MGLHALCNAALACFCALMLLAGCAGSDENLDARLAILEQRLQDLEKKETGGAPLETESALPPQNIGWRAESGPEIVVETVPGRSIVAPPPGAPAGQVDNSGMVFMSQSAYAGMVNAACAPQSAPARTRPTRQTRRTPQPEKKTPAAPAKKPETAAYDAALALVLAGKTAEGRTAMEAFLQTYPQSGLAPNAYYWIGETWYTSKKYDTAILSFKEVTTRFPKHDKAAAALYKLGASYEQLGDKGNAQFYWQALVEDFPASESAALARKKLAAR